MSKIVGMSALRSFRIKGLCSAPVTPMKENGDVNLGLIKDYVSHMLEYNVPNAFVTGTTGEGHNLTVEERKQVTEAWIKEGKGKLSSIIVQVGAGNLRETQTLARHASEAGADGIACVATTYHKPTSMGTYVDYMAAVASAAPSLPFLLYDIDFYTGVTLDVSTFFSLAKSKIPNLCGVKHTSPGFVSINNTQREHTDIQVLLGTDEMLLQGLAVGVDATIMNSYNGHVLTRLREKFEKGDIEGARKEQERMLTVGKIRRKHGLGVVDGSKSILAILGLPVGAPRLPINQPNQATLDAVKADLEQAGFFQWTKK